MTCLAQFNIHHLFLGKHPVKNNEKNKAKTVEFGNQTHQS